MTMIYAAAGILIAVLIFVGIRVYNNSFNPVSRFVNSSGKLMGSSFNFDITAELNETPVMRFNGAMTVKPSKKAVVIDYDADYTEYSYRNVVCTDGSSGDTLSYKGNFYNGQWTVTDCTDMVQEFFDFYVDYRAGRFDGGSFLRFTGMNNKLNASELESFINTIKKRLSTDSEVASITSTYENGYATYDYIINIENAMDFIKSDGASVFYSSPEYNRFVERVEANADSINASAMEFSFTVDPSGYLSAMTLSVKAPEDVYEIRCQFSDFGREEPKLPDSFYSAAGLEPPTE